MDMWNRRIGAGLASGRASPPHVPSVTPAAVPAAGTAAGNYSLVYKICEVLNPTNCDRATVTVPVSPAVIDAVTTTPINQMINAIVRAV